MLKYVSLIPYTNALAKTSGSLLKILWVNKVKVYTTTRSMTYSVWFIELFHSYHARNCDFCLHSARYNVSLAVLKAYHAFVFILELFLCHVYAFAPEVVHGLTSCTESNVTEGLCIFSVRLLGEFLTWQPEFHILFPTLLWGIHTVSETEQINGYDHSHVSQGCPTENEVAKRRGEAGLS